MRISDWSSDVCSSDLLENVQNVVARTVLPGNMLAFGSPDSEKMAELIEEAFAGAPADSMKDVRILFIGTAEQGERVRAAVEPTGAIFVLNEQIGRAHV